MWVIRRDSDGQFYKGVPQTPEQGQVLLFTDDKLKAKRFNEEAKEAAILFRNEVWVKL